MSRTTTSKTSRRIRASTTRKASSSAQDAPLAPQGAAAHRQALRDARRAAGRAVGELAAGSTVSEVRRRAADRATRTALTLLSLVDDLLSPSRSDAWCALMAQRINEVATAAAGAAKIEMLPVLHLQQNLAVAVDTDAPPAEAAVHAAQSYAVRQPVAASRLTVDHWIEAISEARTTAYRRDLALYALAKQAQLVDDGTDADTLRRRLGRQK